MGKKKRAAQKTAWAVEARFSEAPEQSGAGGPQAGNTAAEEAGEDFFNPFLTLHYSLKPGKAEKSGRDKKPSAGTLKPLAQVRRGEQDLALFREAMAAQGFKAVLRAEAGKKDTSGDFSRDLSGDLSGGQGAFAELSAPEDQDARLFAQAMQGVNPVDGRGRDLPLKPKNESRAALAGETDYLKDFLEGKIEFALEYTDEFFEGHVVNMDPLVTAKLRAGQYSPEASLDLHGQNAEQARETLINFIRHAYNNGQRSLVVVTGRGKNSPGGLGVLRKSMQEWLTRNPLKRVVLAFCTAKAKDGGTGALYILLRKLKKSNGKIHWERWEV
jgi:DNA-nicking Smr family endonuclease